jgi:hypothetical protein
VSNVDERNAAELASALSVSIEEALKLKLISKESAELLGWKSKARHYQLELF